MRKAHAMSFDFLLNTIPVAHDINPYMPLLKNEKTIEELPANAKAYIKRLEEAVGVPIDIVSTGPDRNETIVLNSPFD